MRIVRLPVGQQSPVDADCIRIEQSADAEYKLSASALCGEDDGSDSVTLVNGLSYTSVEGAEEAGLVWAANVGVERLFISVGTLEHPLETLEIDGPL